MPNTYDNVTDVFKTLADVVEEATKDSFPDNPVILSHQDGAEPLKSYCSVYTLGIDPVGRSYVSTLADENEILTISHNYEIRTQYSFLGPQGLGMAMKFHHAINSNPLITGYLQENRFGIVSKGGIKSVPKLRETKFEENYTIDVTYSLMLVTQQQVYTVETVNFTDPLTGAVISVSAT